MKSFVVFCVVLVAGIHAASVPLTPAQQEKVKQSAAECIKETGVTSEALAEIQKMNFIDDEGLKNFAFCFFKKAGIIDADGKLNIETALAKLPPGIDKEAAKKVLEGCSTKSGKDTTDTAYEILKCYHQGTDTHISFGF